MDWFRKPTIERTEPVISSTPSVTRRLTPATESHSRREAEREFGPGRAHIAAEYSRLGMAPREITRVVLPLINGTPSTSLAPHEIGATRAAVSRMQRPPKWGVRQSEATSSGISLVCAGDGAQISPSRT